MIAPDDVRAVPRTKHPIYVISTNEVNKRSRLRRRLQRISQRTGGQAFFARTWQRQVEAFESIREALATPTPSPITRRPIPNEGFRKISVEIPSDVGKKYRIRARPGYRPRGGF